MGLLKTTKALVVICHKIQMMGPTILKLAASVCIILICVHIGKKYPPTAGLIATMPLVGLIVLVWLRSDNPGNNALMEKYTTSALCGIIPCILFYVAALICFKKNISFSITMIASFAVWLIGAIIHQKLLK